MVSGRSSAPPPPQHQAAGATPSSLSSARGRQEVGNAAASRLGGLLNLLLVTRTALETFAPRTILTRTLVALPIFPRTLIPRTLIPGALLTGPILAGPILAGALVPTLAPLKAITTRLPLLTIGPVLAFARLVKGFLLALAIERFLIALVLVFALGRTLVLEAGAGLTEHTEIMVRELEIIFGLDAVAGKLGVTRHVLVLFEQLRGIATAALLTAVAASAASPETSRLLTPATATAAALAIVHQA